MQRANVGMKNTRARPCNNAHGVRGNLLLNHRRTGNNTTENNNNNNKMMMMRATVEGIPKVLAAAALAATLSLGSAQTAQAAPKAPVPAERKKGRVVINRSSAGVKNFAKQSVVDVPSVPSLPGSDYKKAGSAEPKAPRRTRSGGPSFSMPSFSMPSFSAPSVSIDAPSVSFSSTADDKTQAIAVLGAEIVAAAAATATVGSLTKQ
ncbi:hypothetical protein HOP50_07g50410 [Chloropicon primus]|uniref:Uncharacterized protein n=1 Tax=Chloropicon primus TaxID=1764295 RepID=A0A5B8MP90_9CHLO|nr:hypothetical protein A3770_07p50160 [Chloropicon primus]UPR01719.1 hypothetical protein HOP50_07g50410 [Chloropicon primus]|eukprot:QDZ22498.1 hypothetical protein A3770_07p50160 [Chloropicon primus]